MRVEGQRGGGVRARLGFLLVAVITTVFLLVFGREILARAAASICPTNIQSFPSPGGMYVAVREYTDCEGATGAGSISVGIRRAWDPRLTQIHWILDARGGTQTALRWLSAEALYVCYEGHPTTIWRIDESSWNGVQPVLQDMTESEECWRQGV